MRPRPENSTFRGRRWAAWLLFAVTAGMTYSLAWGAPDDFEVEARAKEPAGANLRANNIVVEQLTLEQIDSWAFQSNGHNREAWIKSCDANLKSRLAEVEAIEPLSDPQRAALKLAMQGDIQRVLIQLDKFLEKHPPNSGPVNNEQWNALWQEMQPIRQQVSKGIFRKGSLFSKALRQNASETQWNRLHELDLERRKKRWLLAVQIMIVQLEQSCPMRHEQREALTKVLSDRPPPNLNSDNGALYVALAILASTPAEKWKAPFDERQVAKIEAYAGRYRGMTVVDDEGDE